MNLCPVFVLFIGEIAKMSISNIPPVSIINNRQKRLKEVKEEVHRPVDELNITRSLHHHGFNYNDITDVEKIDLFV